MYCSYNCIYYMLVLNDTVVCNIGFYCETPLSSFFVSYQRAGIANLNYLFTECYCLCLLEY